MNRIQNEIEQIQLQLQQQQQVAIIIKIFKQIRVHQRIQQVLKRNHHFHYVVIIPKHYLNEHQKRQIIRMKQNQRNKQEQEQEQEEEELVLLVI